MKPFSLLAASVLFAASLLAAPAHAQHEAGDFDFYVLALSWSPSYCASEGAQNNDIQCRSARPYAFVVHGLWPQYERGFPEYCNRSAPRIPQRQIDSMLDLMPSPRLVINQWRKHGLCAGESSGDYFKLVRTARENITIPEKFRGLDNWMSVSPNEVERAFIDANPGLTAAGIAVTCDSRHLREVRICMTKDLEFRACREVDRRACKSNRVVMPPTR